MVTFNVQLTLFFCSLGPRLWEAFIKTNVKNTCRHRELAVGGYSLLNAACYHVDCVEAREASPGSRNGRIQLVPTAG